MTKYLNYWIIKMETLKFVMGWSCLILGVLTVISTVIKSAAGSDSDKSEILAIGWIIASALFFK